MWTYVVEMVLYIGGVVGCSSLSLLLSLSLSLGECCLSGEQGSSKIIFDENSCIHCVEFGRGVML